MTVSPLSDLSKIWTIKDVEKEVKYKYSPALEQKVEEEVAEEIKPEEKELSNETQNTAKEVASSMDNVKKMIEDAKKEASDNWLDPNNINDCG